VTLVLGYEILKETYITTTALVSSSIDSCSVINYFRIDDVGILMMS
jgi:hypothetical protein